ncbi:hypothetical protein PMZ80_001123 [Knufia obscura]|uniref:BTB domain-containing protein n=1 Tax=Knufia obscura TaxID=1635080 RepID=A0ABR0S263_9EURO|nr:hypothetical protein PMZ80_001123 [Knufia obscura]
MDTNFRGFASENFILNIGKNGTQLKVPQDILTKIPFFANALNGGRFEETKKKVFDLPEDDPQAVADVIYFTYADSVNPIFPQVSLAEAQQVDAYIRAWIQADKFKAEKAANILVDRIVEFHDDTPVEPRELDLLSKAGHEHSALYDVLVAELGWLINVGTYSKTGSAYSLHEYEEIDFDSACAELSKEDLLRLMKVVRQCTTDNLSPTTRAISDPCAYHKHDLTEPSKDCIPDDE